MPKIIFNSSLPRSGSTLLQNILAQNPFVFASPTDGVLELLFAARQNFTNLNEFKLQDASLMTSAWLGFCRGAIEGWCDGITDKPVVVLKSRGFIQYYHWLSQFYPDPKIIVCIRDIRSILSSMEKIHRRNAYLHDASENPARLEMVSIESRVKHWLHTPPVGLALARLRNAIHEKIDDKLLFVRYEDLTRNPFDELTRIYEYIGEPSMKHAFDSVPQAVNENDAVHGKYGDHKIRTCVTADKPDWNETLGEELAAGVVNNFGWFYERFYPGLKF